MKLPVIKLDSYWFNFCRLPCTIAFSLPITPSSSIPLLVIFPFSHPINPSSSIPVLVISPFSHPINPSSSIPVLVILPFIQGYSK